MTASAITHLKCPRLEPDQGLAVGGRAFRKNENLAPTPAGFLPGFDFGLGVELGPRVGVVVRAVAGSSLDLTPDVLASISLASVDEQNLRT